ncbi:MAG TPA: DUF2520 domain-containing protein, partial [Thermoanaerobaculia bacterium]|nr:DUF2520 domain-containing protein [Thermoanaerobaculia bacterium]
MKLGIIGGGRAAWAFGIGWLRAGESLAGVALRTGSSSDLPTLLGTSALRENELIAASDLLLLALPDAALGEVAPRIAARAADEALLFHPSGSISSAVFGGRGRAFTLHPLRSLPPVGEPVDLADTLFVFEGEAKTREVAKEIATALGGTFAEIAEANKTLYHASAVLGSNGVAALLEASADLFARCGLEGPAMQRAIAGLAQSAVANWEGSRERFTGPVMRGEKAAVERHLAALGASDRERAELYRRLALEIAEAVRRR